MRFTRRWLAILFVVGLFSYPTASIGQTPDEQTPAVEEACTKYEAEGARHGLCIAYCEAQDCEGLKLDPMSCVRIQEQFIAYSVKRGYTPGKNPAPISCTVERCTRQDRELCKGSEIDCIDPADPTRACVSNCSAHFIDFDIKGNPICTIEPPCKPCVGDTPKP